MGSIFDTLLVIPFTNALLLIYAFVGDFGLAIILFTILIRLLTHPFMVSQIKSSTAMQELTQSDEYKKIQEKYKKDQEKLGQETMRMYQERGINPFSSCLPMLLQFPIMIGFYWSIARAIGSTPMHLLDVARNIYPWLGAITPKASLAALIPIQSHFLWMDLGQPERIFLPFLPFVAIPTLAIIVGITTFIQSKLTMPASTNPNDQSAQMTQSMTLVMPIMFFMITLNYASGLAVYFITSNLISVLQYAALGKINWRGLLGGTKANVEVKSQPKKKSAKRS